MTSTLDPEAIVLRRATAEDWPQMWPIWHEVVAAADTYVYEPSTDEKVARGRWLDAPEGETWVATLGDRVAGFYRISANHEGPGAHVANGSYMVDAAIRGHGVGRRLVEHSLDRATAIGFRAMQFNAVAETNVGAISLYERIGFTSIGIVPEGFRHPTDGLVGLRIMHLDLTGR